MQFLLASIMWTFPSSLDRSVIAIVSGATDTQSNGHSNKFELIVEMHMAVEQSVGISRTSTVLFQGSVTIKRLLETTSLIPHGTRLGFQCPHKKTHIWQRT